MALTVNPDAGVSALESFREETVYAFRFDTNCDMIEDVAFKVVFSTPKAEEGRHPYQTYQVRRTTGSTVRNDACGDLLIEGQTDEILEDGSGLLAYAGLAPDVSAADGIASETFRSVLLREASYRRDIFQDRCMIPMRRNNAAIVVEVPIKSIGWGHVTCWATASLIIQASEVQVCRCSLPLLTNMFDREMRDQYDRSAPKDDRSRFGTHIAAIGEHLSRLGSARRSPAKHGKMLADRLLPDVLPYELDTPASFSVTRFNGRGLADNPIDVMLALVANIVTTDEVAPGERRTRPWFPYFGSPYAAGDISEPLPVAT